MGRRSRKRSSGEELSAPASTRAERDAARAARPASRARYGSRRGGERPRAPWGSFPLTELVVLLAIVLLVLSFVIGLETPRGRVAFTAGLVLGFLAGLETAVRDHFSGYRSHSTLLSAACSVAAMIGLALLLRTVAPDAATPLVLSGVFAFGALLFAFVFPAFRRAFRARSGGVSFR